MPDAGSPTEKMPEDVPLGVAERDEELVSGLPGARDRALGRARDVPVAEVRAPVELPLVDHVRAAAQELRVHDRVEPFAGVRRAEQRLDGLLVAVDAADDVVVPLGAIEVDDDRVQAERGADSRGDLVEQAVGLVAHPDEADDVDEALDPGHG